MSMNTGEFLHRLDKLVELAVWDNNGKMFGPVWGYDGQIREYAPFTDAVHALTEDFFNPYERATGHSSTPQTSDKQI